MLETATSTSYGIPRKAWTTDDLLRTKKELENEYGKFDDLYNRYLVIGLSADEYEAMATMRKIQFLLG